MVFFHPDGHALFLLALCIIGPLLTFGLIALITGAGELRRAAAADARRSGLVWDGAASEELGGVPRHPGLIEASPASAAQLLETANDAHPRHATAGA